MNYDCEQLRRSRQSEFGSKRCRCGEGYIEVWIRPLSVPAKERQIAGCMSCGEFGSPASDGRQAVSNWRRECDPDEFAARVAKSRAFGAPRVANKVAR